MNSQNKYHICPTDKDYLESPFRMGPCSRDLISPSIATSSTQPPHHAVLSSFIPGPKWDALWCNQQEVFTIMWQQGQELQEIQCTHMQQGQVIQKLRRTLAILANIRLMRGMRMMEMIIVMLLLDNITWPLDVFYL